MNTIVFEQIRKLNQDVFHWYYYYNLDTWPRNTFLGYPIQQCPFELKKEQSASFDGTRKEFLELLSVASPTWVESRRVLDNWPDPDAGLNGSCNH